MNNFDPNYVHRLNYFIVGTKAVLQNSERKILVMKRSSEIHLSSKWSLPGGAVEKNENPDIGILREIQEETQLKTGPLDIYVINFHPDAQKPTIIIGYKGNISSGQEVKLNWEHTEYKFLNKDEALKLDLTEDGRFFIENS